MNPTITQHDELDRLIAALCDDRIVADELARLEQIVLADDAALARYVDYLSLHGDLHWDVAVSDQNSGFILSQTVTAASTTQPTTRHSSSLRTAALVASLLMLCGVGWALLQTNQVGNVDTPLVEHSPHGSTSAATSAPNVTTPGTHETLPVVKLGSGHGLRNDESTGTSDSIVSHDQADNQSTGSIQPVQLPLAQFIDKQVADGWADAEVTPSAHASDAEWIRRVYLDLVGHIPPTERVEQFISDRSARKRSVLVSELLAEPDYVRHWSTVWTNLLVGRSTNRNVDRQGLTKFLAKQFEKNRPWNETVTELIAAQGTAEENGATNFLLAHLNNEAVPATAITARVFLGTQVQCMQCHKHPFNDWDQDTFWELNSFFQQTKIVERPRESPTSPVRLELVSDRTGGPTLFEDRRGIMRMAYPKYAGEEISPGESIDRRAELARIMASGDKPQLALAFVNRMWGHFFGHGFTPEIDDMGPHRAASHPELLERLAREFVASGYDVRQLMRWIVLSDPYSRSSRFGNDNQSDNPDGGETPLFSRMYVKPLTAEQLFDSLVIAATARSSRDLPWEKIEAERQQWVQQFYRLQANDENTEDSSFGSNLTQALLMMNGDLIDQALAIGDDTRLKEVLTGSDNAAQQIRQISLAALSRPPSQKELNLLRRQVQQATANRSEVLRDVFWAYLNSGEFVMNH